MSGMYAVFAAATPARAFSTASSAARISGFSSQASFTYSDFDKVSKLASTSGSSSNFVSRGRPDRKSTRLNSSHTVISYAVFCLKKKTAVTEIGAAQDARAFNEAPGGALHEL